MTEMGLRQRKAERTRQAILNAAWLLFTRDGVAATSIRSVAELAEVSEVTLYTYFGSRQLLVDEVMSKHASMDRILAAIAERPASEGPIEVLRAISQHQGDMPDDQFQVSVRIMNLINNDPVMRGAYQRLLGGYIEQQVDSLAERAEAIGMSRRELKMLCYAFSGMVDALSEEPEAVASAKAWADATDEVLLMLERGWGRTP
ncbi:TetR/AcrR family transcriptional regulator [Arthrobacter sp. 18067]|uniref:TetR/AcrR family transcriptional regulator n=1 Tax=Arthrobacter sp. 18067 TaxID=2681413 RepID=UPI0013580145|nr:TetR/AcrR family transcriptional regulator [Arthrobacter sp. 18067]